MSCYAFFIDKQIRHAEETFRQDMTQQTRSFIKNNSEMNRSSKLANSKDQRPNTGRATNHQTAIHRIIVSYHHNK